MDEDLTMVCKSYNRKLRVELVVCEPNQLHQTSAIFEGKLRIIIRKIVKLEFVQERNCQLLTKNR